MGRNRLVLLAALVVIVATIPLFAQDDSTSQAEEMPPMGPPPELKELEALVGDWDVEGRFKMGPEAEWQPTEAVVTYSMTVGGAALQMDYKSTFAGMDFVGHSLMTYDRETKMWQSTWVDNMAARISLYTGTMGDDKMVLLGMDMFQGQPLRVRMTTYNMSDTLFNWMMESSVDGENWTTGMEATYTKRK